MDVAIMWLKVAKDETTTMATYAEQFQCLDETERENVREQLLEIMGDEANHTLVALFNACQRLGITIPTDGLEQFDGLLGGEE